jgi:phosphohistidine swiveling domain-containing protein
MTVADVLDVYHFHDAPVPRAPAETLSTELLPEQTVAGVAVAVGFVDAEFTVSVHRLLAALTVHQLLTRHERIVALSKDVGVNE